MKDMGLFRMIGWLPVGLFFYFASIAAGTDHAQLQLLFWKVGHACTFSWIGYWISRQVTGRLEQLKDIDTVPEAVVYAAQLIGRVLMIGFVLAVSHGL